MKLKYRLRNKISIELFNHLAFLLAFFLIYSCKNSVSSTKTDAAKSSQQKTIRKKKPQEEIKKIETTLLDNESAPEHFRLKSKKHHSPTFEISTPFGAIKIKLYDETPIHKASFIYLVNKKYFDNTYIHRISKEFIMQFGSSDSPKLFKQRSKLGYSLLPPEFDKSIRHKKGSVAAARKYKNNPNKLSDAFEFYIVSSDFGSLTHIDDEHTVFGEVIDGWDAIKKIDQQETDSKEWPLIDIPIKIKMLSL